MQSNILVTGASGFIGSHMVNHLTKADNKVISMIRGLKPDLWSKTALSGSTRVRINLNNDNSELKSLCAYYEIDQIYHFASQAIVSRAKKDPVGTWKINVMGTSKILEIARQLDIKEILMMSSDKIYGEGLNASGDKNYNPTEPYSSSKIAQELITNDYRREYDLRVAQIRCCNAYGYDPYNPTRIVPNTIIRLLNNRAPVIYNPQSMRQYIYINDLIKILAGLMTADGPVNISTPSIYSTVEIINTIIRLMDVNIEPIIIDAGFTEIERQSMEFTFEEYSLTPLQSALSDTIDMFGEYWGK